MKTIFTSKPILALLFVLFVLFAGTNSYAQECPADKVCISPEAARKALADADTVDQQRAEIAVLRQAIEDLRKELNKMRVEFAEKAGENTALRQNAVSDRAIIEVLLKNSKKRCAPFSILCL